MKFGVTLKEARYDEWKNSYIDYSGLKKFIKQRQAKKPWDDTDEQAFVNELDKELKKVADFQTKKISDLHETIAAYELEVKDLTSHVSSKGAPSSSGGPSASTSNGPRQPEDEDDDDDDESIDEEDEKRYQELEDEIQAVVADVHDLGHFSHLNYTGFIKIVKKHDKKTGWELRRDFIRHHLESRPFYRENYEALVVQLSRLFNNVRTRGHPVTGDSAAGGGQSAFVRQTTKYWVHRDNFVALKLLVLKHLPVLVFNPDKKFEQADSAISSIYYDNADLDLYLGRLEKTEGAEAIRMRWYGGMAVKQIFVERKTHREDWTGEKSVKARFGVPEDQLNGYLAGDQAVFDTFEAIRKKGKKSDKEVDAMIRLAREVQDRVAEKKLRPCVRTFYNRTAFQQPGDARVRISFDTDLTMVREDDFDGIDRTGGNWRRPDVGIDFPFEKIAESEKHVFPYGVLEVKLQTQLGQEPPEWVKDLVSGPLVEAVPKFSKFIHGCATLMPDLVSLVPFWLPQMDTDIKKSGDDKVIERPPPSSSNPTTSTTPSDTPLQKPRQDVYAEPVSEGEDGLVDDDDEDRLRQEAKASEESFWAGLPEGAAAEAKAFREKRRREEADGDGLLKVPSFSKIAKGGPDDDTFAKLTPANLKRLLKMKKRPEERRKRKAKKGSTDGGSDDDLDDEDDELDELEEEDEEDESRATSASGKREDPRKVGATAKREGKERGQAVEYLKNFKAPTGKKVSVPIRIEPKVYFATERTYLTWLEFSVLLSAIAVTMLNFTPVDDPVGFEAAAGFTIVALLAVAYSTGMFVYRVLMIRKRRAAYYHDAVGPTALCVVLLIAVAVNFILRLKQDAA